MAGVFLSYRRNDAGGWAGRLRDHLIVRYGPERVWQDVDDIPVGVEYLKEIFENIEAADAVLIIIGPHWLDDGHGGGKARLASRQDVLRQEIQHALKKPTGVIPTLVGGASMPSAGEVPRSLAPLFKRNGLAINDSDWARSMQLLFERLQDLSRAARGLVPLDEVYAMLSELQDRFFQRLETDPVEAIATAQEALALLDEHSPSYPHDSVLQLFRGYFLKNLAMAMRDSGDHTAYEAQLNLAAQTLDTIRGEAELQLANAYTGAAAVPMLRGDGARARDLIESALALVPNHPYALHDRDEIRRVFGL
jgi:tetratricopeptide (TPR) repeat protein